MAISSLGLTMQNLVSQTATQFQDYLNDMNTYALQRMTPGTDTFPNPYNLDNPIYDFPDKPVDSGTLDLQDEQLIKVTTPFPVFTPPPPITIEDKWAEEVPHLERLWVSSELDTLINLIENMASGDSSWFSNTYQIKAFDSDRDRRLQTLDDSLRLIAAKHAARGFRLPTSMLHAQENEVIQKYQFDLTNLSREITKIVEEAARDFMKYGVEKGLSYEELNIGFTTAYDKLLIEKTLAIVDVYIKQVEATAKIFEAEVKAIISQFEAEIAAWALTNEYNKVQMEVDLYPIKKYSALVEGAAAKGELDFKTWSEKVAADYNSLSTGMTTASDTIKSAMAADVNITTSKA